MKITVKQAREYYELDAITGISAIRDSKNEGSWLLICHGKKDQTYDIATFRGDWKVYASLDTLVKDVEEISGRVSGFSFI